MKYLIGAACVCIIAATGYYIFGDYLSYRQNQETAFRIECDQIRAQAADMDSLPTDEVAVLKARGRKCINYLLTGEVPN